MRRSIAIATAVVASALIAVAACAPPAPSGMKSKPPARSGGGGGSGGSAGPSAGSASAGPGGPQDAGSSGGGGVTTFRVLCDSSHAAPDDPIVFPGAPGRSHMHQFFGNRTTNAASTTASLLGQGTTCTNPADGSAYWVPMLYQNGVAIPALSSLIYYRGGSHRNPAGIQAFPSGLRIIAGSATATAPFPLDAVAWMCQGMSNMTTTPPNCGSNTLVLQIRFPDCWDGRNLDSADHKSHMAYTVGGFCPSNYPVQVPLLEYNVRYKTNGNAGITLASGSAYTYHADYFNAWNQTALTNLINLCLHSGKVCGTV
jgi:uncharacterized protein DUF1996